MEAKRGDVRGAFIVITSKVGCENVDCSWVV
jgi:hypothetical protein